VFLNSRNQTPIHVVPLFSFLSAVPPSDEEVKGHDRFDGQQFQLEPNRPLYYDSPSITGEREELYYTVPNWSVNVALGIQKGLFD
jgi:hypothetical protein